MTGEGLSFKALCPSGTGECEYLVPARDLEHLKNNGPVSRQHELVLAAQVLREPDAIYFGLKRQGKETGLCYVGKPKQQQGDWWSSTPPKGCVFAVYVSCEHLIFEWRWELEDGNVPGPKGAQTRYGKLKWKR